VRVVPELEGEKERMTRVIGGSCVVPQRKAFRIVRSKLFPSQRYKSMSTCDLEKNANARIGAFGGYSEFNDPIETSVRGVLPPLTWPRTNNVFFYDG
jgi:hypothetical protein